MEFLRIINQKHPPCFHRKPLAFLEDNLTHLAELKLDNDSLILPQQKK